MILWTLVKLPFKIIFYFIWYFLWSKYFLIFFTLYAIGSYFLVKHLMKATKKYIEIKEEENAVHEKYKMFRRLDRTHWDEKSFLMGAILFSWIKLAGVLSAVVICYVGMKIILWGKNVEDEEVKKDKSIRRKIDFLGKFCATLVTISCGIIVTEKKIDFDYSKYLGAAYERDEKNIKVSTHVSNHTSWLDIPIMMTKFNPGFISRIEVKSYPLVGFVATCIGSIFVDRNDKLHRGSVLSQVTEKQKRIYKGEDLSKLHIFPEGTTSNTTGIITFKQGAFLSKLPVKPYIIKFDPVNRLSLAMDVIEMLVHLFLVLCKPIHKVELLTLPAFPVNDYLFTHSSYVGQPEWKIYGETIRDIMCEASGLEKSEGDYEMKKQYLDFLRMPKFKTAKGVSVGVNLGF